MAKRFRAKVYLPGDPGEIELGKTLHSTRERALKEGVDIALSEGVVVVEEVEAVQEVKRSWVEKKS